MLPIIKGDGFLLRQMKLADAYSIAENVNDKDVVRYTLHIPHPYKKKDALWFIRRSFHRIRNMIEYPFGIEIDGDICGVVSITNIDHANQSGELGYWLGKRYWNSGIMTEALEMIMRWGFEEEKFHRLHAKLYATNLGSARVLEKAGLKKAGHIKEARYKDGRWHDELIFSILRAEWKK